MIIYHIPIKCTPQIICVAPEAEIIEVTEPKKVGQLYFPFLVVRSRSGPCPPEDLLNLTVHSIKVSRDIKFNENYRDSSTVGDNNIAYRSMISLFEHPTLPVNDQEQRMTYRGSFTHQYSKDKYYVYVESLTNSGYGGITLTPGSGASRAVDEGRLTRTFV